MNQVLHLLNPVFDFFGYGKTDRKPRPGEIRTEGIAMDTFRQRLSVNRASMGPHIQTAPGFDYAHWKPYGQHRVRVNHEDDFAIQCQGLKPYVQTIAESVWLGREETRWAGLSRPEPQRPLGSQVGSRYGSRGASREMLSGSRELLAR